MGKRKWLIHKDDNEKLNKFLFEIKEDTKNLKNERHYKIFKNALYNANREKWTRAEKCYFPFCNNPAITDSHSISNKLMLNPIAENGHLISPRLNLFTEKIEVNNPIGIKKASVFPGFCREHENKFRFENEGEIKSESELQMHLFRSVCYHLHFLKAEKKKSILIRDYFSDLFLPLIDDFISCNPKLITSKTEVRSFLESEILGERKLRVRQRKADIKYTMKNWFYPNANYFGKKLPSSLFSQSIELKPLLKIALSAPYLLKGTPVDHENSPDFNFNIYINVFPNKGKSMIHLVSKKERKNELVELANSFEKSPGLGLNFIQRIMLFHTENWFMAPSIWNGLPLGIKEKLLNSMNNKSN